MAALVKRSSYRLRVVQNADGSVEIVFGNDPVDPSLKVLVDNWVDDMQSVQTFAGSPGDPSAQAPAAPAAPVAVDPSPVVSPLPSDSPAPPSDASAPVVSPDPSAPVPNQVSS